MTQVTHTRERVEMIRIDEIHVLNPRTRSKKGHRELIDNIRAVGLKRPITVSRRSAPAAGRHYDLICGQGRLEALQALRQTEIPAFVLDATEEDCLVMSLVENVARPQHRPIDLMKEVGRLRERGHSDVEIGQKIGVTASWVNMIGGLLERGEEKLLSAVETGLIPLSMATDIARSSESEIQNLLAEAYEQGFRGKKLTTVRHLLERRAKRHKLVRGNPLGGGKHKRKTMTTADLRRLFEREAEKQRLTIKKASFTSNRLIFATEALKELMATPEFSRLLRVERLDSLPRLLQDRIQSGDRP
ncbi:plasmid partitioning protein RepB C-terminal domain-containing protein [Solimonas terrae]|uniref:ParB N-terminal domain-containing protein n=1 Tax=Solimonas terrae TaxID=1396819 RepID=A0A6M2BUH4_9GAMM|nr:plasmid partitioning protein RepB C-terminal domain-containing protein [Solimonas terrae]NGY05895.1 ParB N-terminal domain-containing protein [Solimonas terrae]